MTTTTSHPYAFAGNAHCRARRMELFFDLLATLPKPLSLLDVGGTTEFWRGKLPSGVELTILNIFKQEPIQGEQVVVGSALNLPFRVHSFDVVFSNSALAFVGNHIAQKQMANEIRSVGRRYFVQTPNQDFPIDWRTLVPFFHWLKPTTQAWILNTVSVGRYKKVRDPAEAWHLVTRVRDVTRPELAHLFPDGEIISEKFLGLDKSFTVLHGFEK